MSVNGSNKEFLFATFLKLHQEILEEELGVKIDYLHLEKTFKSRRVDMNGSINGNKERLLIELQTDNSYPVHFQQVQELIAIANENERTTIVYGSFGAKDNMITELMQTVVFYSERNIRLVLLTINQDIIPVLQEINVINKTLQIKELERLKDIDKIFIDKKSIEISNNVSTNLIKEEQEIMSYEEELLLSILKRLRFDSRDLSVNIHRYKNLSKKNFGIGGGIQDVTFKVLINRNKIVGIELTFDNIGKELYYNLLKNRQTIDDEFNYILKWDKKFQKIGSYYPLSWFYTERETMVNRVSRDVKAFLIGFDRHLKKAIEEMKNSD
ncbi:DUF4268 domain-containing protein [Clostridium saccharobutylicum]|uniref:DUF4268 domain-containing protein n=1 Tax=Clostridium saccharobutylicum TaxID=169679 RepID=A0A1S8MNH3_CLOSA|nr:DUF4268 domain-containing protein [Clostridium saccharobutylicum]OOM05677.1 hypothetical protein CLOSAC_45460 [Clostridium saccharobutylicum]